MENNNLIFIAGKNIAMKVPPHLFVKTVAFYRDIIKLPAIKESEPYEVFEFGDKKLWIDKVDHLSQSEIWLEIECNDIKKAKAYFKNKNIIFREEIEELPKKLKAFWIAGPNDIIHLIKET